VTASLLVEESDVQQIAGMMRNDWQQELKRSGLAFAPPKPPENEEAARHGVTCPACGTTAALVDGHCSDCGLFLG